MPTFSSAVTTVTRTKIIPKCYDIISKGSPVLAQMLSNAKDWADGNKSGGTKYEFPVTYKMPTTGGFVGYADKLDSSREDTRVTASFEPKMCHQPVVLADLETTLNQGDERVISLLDIEFDTAAKAILDKMGTGLYTGTGIGNSMDSLANAADDSTNYATYGGLARATYAGMKGYYLASAGALTLNKMATAYDAVETGTEKPTVIATTKALWSGFEALLSPTVRMGYSGSGYPRMDRYGFIGGNAQAFQGNIGFDTLFFRGTPVVKDDYCPSGKMFLLNMNYIGFKGITLKDSSGSKKYETLNFKRSGNDETPNGVIGRNPSTRGFQFRIMMSPVDQLTEVGYLLYAGNVIAEQARLQGQMAGLS